MIIGLSVFFTLAFAGIGFFVYQNFKPLKQPSQSSSPSMSPSPSFRSSISPTPDPTADWKTYTSQSGYSLKYPPEWEIKTGDWTESGDHYGIQSDDEVVIRYRNPNQVIRGGPPDAVSISLKQPLNNRKLMNAADFATQYLSSPSSYSGSIHTEGIVIGAASATKVSRSDFPSISNIFIPQSDKMFLIVFNPTGDSAVIGTYQQIFNQILSTFKLSVSDEEKAKIDAWIKANDLNPYGDSKDIMYTGGTPLFDERTGEKIDRYDYIISRHPDRPWE